MSRIVTGAVIASLSSCLSRYASLLGIRKAAKAPITEWGAGELGVEATAKTKVAGRQLPPARPEGELFQGEADELVDTLVEKLAEAKFI